MSKLLTIVIPCYNVELYLQECLDSILLSEYNDVLEVLAINDGSKDNTLSILNGYAGKYPEMLRVIDKPNGGWGSVINLAIKEARGSYFKILDSDDWFEKEAFAEFMETLKHCGADIFISNFTEHYSDRIVEGKHYDEAFCNRLLSLDGFIEKNHGFSLFPMTNITVKADILKKGNVVLPDRYYSDISFFVYVHALSQTLYITNLNVYQYRKAVEGQSTSIEGYKRNYKDYIKMTNSLIDFYASASLSKLTRKHIKSLILRNIKFSYKLLMSKEFCGAFNESKNILTEFNKYLKKSSSELYYASQFITNKHIPFVLIWRLFNINLFKLR